KRVCRGRSCQLRLRATDEAGSFVYGNSKHAAASSSCHNARHWCTLRGVPAHKESSAMTAVLFPPAGVRVFQVGELTREVKSLLEENLGTVWVEGEVSNLARPASGHLYLTLKDNEAPLRAVMYRGVALRMRFDLRDGMSVVVKGRLTVF